MPKIGQRNKALNAALRSKASHPLRNRNDALRYRDDLIRMTMVSKQPRNEADMAEITAATDILMERYAMSDPFEVPSIIGRGRNGRTLDDSDYDQVVISTVPQTSVNAQWVNNEAATLSYNASARRDVRLNRDMGRKYVTNDFGKQNLTSLGIQTEQQSLYLDSLPKQRDDINLQPWRQRNLDDEDDEVLDMNYMASGLDATSQTVAHMDSNLIASYIRNAGALI